MAHKIELSARAESSLEEIYTYYLVEHSYPRALKVIDSIDKAFNTIAKAPKRNPICFDIDNPVEFIRQMIVHNTFKILYKISGEEIEIIEIFHGSRDANLLKDIS